MRGVAEQQSPIQQPSPVKVNYNLLLLRNPNKHKGLAPQKVMEGETLFAVAKPEILGEFENLSATLIAFLGTHALFD